MILKEMKIVKKKQKREKRNKINIKFNFYNICI